MTSIACRRLCKRYGAAIAVEDVSFEVESGELCALLGPSGSGKSTVLRMIAGLERPTSGDVLLGGQSVADEPPQKRELGFVFQHYALFAHLPVWENVAFALKLRHMDEDALGARVAELLELFGLADLASRLPGELSGGQRQRVAFARALAARPRVLLLDEPFAALDARLRDELRGFLREMHDRAHVTSLFVTHDQEEAQALADRVVVMSGGHVEQVGQPRAVYDRPASDFVADFMGPMNTFRARIEGGRARAGGFEMEVQPGLSEGCPVVVRIRPDDVEVSRGLRGMPGVVRRVQFLGALVRVTVDIVRGGPQVYALMPRRRADRLRLEPSQRVRVRVQAGRVTPGGHDPVPPGTNDSVPLERTS
jgi:sulfate transport system ATP-binding protein